MGIPVAQFGDVLVEPRRRRGALLQAGWRAVLKRSAPISSRRASCAPIRSSPHPACSRAPSRSSQLDAPFADLTWRVGRDGPSTPIPPASAPITAGACAASGARRDQLRARRGPARRPPPRRPGDRDEAGLADAPRHHRADDRRSALCRLLPRSRRRCRGRHARCGSHRSAAMAVPIGIDLSLDCKGRSFGHVIATHPDHERGGVGEHPDPSQLRQRQGARQHDLRPAGARRCLQARTCRRADRRPRPRSCRSRSRGGSSAASAPALARRR